MTDTHRLYSASRDQWVAAGALWEGEYLRGSRATVPVVGMEVIEGGRQVFNLEVEGQHRYLVGAAQVVAHNAGFDCDSTISALPHQGSTDPLGTQKRIADAKDYAGFSHKGSQARTLVDDSFGPKRFIDRPFQRDGADAQTLGHRSNPGHGRAGSDTVRVSDKSIPGQRQVSASSYSSTPKGLTPRAARRQAMREAGIPTSQQPVAQSSVRAPGNVPAGRQYDYDVPSAGGGTQRMSVQHSLTDDVPGHGPHWEAGPVKKGGQTDNVGRPRLQSGKAKVNE